MKTTVNLARVLGNARWTSLLLVAAVLLGACGRSKDCDKSSVTCADELRFLGGDGPPDSPFGWIFQSKNGAVISAVDYKATLAVDTLTGTSRKSYDAQELSMVLSDLIAVRAEAPAACPLRTTLTVRDADLSRGTSLKDVRCYDATCIEVDCDKFTLDRKAIIYPVENETQAKEAAPHVRCEGFTYRRTNDLPDITWNMRSYFSYKFKDEPSVMSYRFATGPFLGPAVTKPSDVNNLFEPDVTNPKLLVADTPYGIRLPMRMEVKELAPASGTNDKVLRAGWNIESYTVGCAMKQSVMADIVKTALNGASIGKSTLHIRFNENAQAVPAGEEGWCSYFAEPGEEPAFQTYVDTKNNEDCAVLK